MCTGIEQKGNVVRAAKFKTVTAVVGIRYTH